MPSRKVNGLARTWGYGLGLLLLAGACKGGDDEMTMMEPPFEPVGFNAAGRGNDLVVIDGDREAGHRDRIGTDTEPLQPGRTRQHRHIMLARAGHR